MNKLKNHGKNLEKIKVMQSFLCCYKCNMVVFSHVGWSHQLFKENQIWAKLTQRVNTICLESNGLQFAISLGTNLPLRFPEIFRSKLIQNMSQILPKNFIKVGIWVAKSLPEFSFSYYLNMLLCFVQLQFKSRLFGLDVFSAFFRK